MMRFLGQRLMHSVLVLLVVSVLAFLVSTLIGDPVASILGLNSTAEAQAELRERLHLNDPIIARYFAFIIDMARGDLGMSYATHRPVADLFLERIPATLELACLALILSLLIGLPIGVYTAVLHRRWTSNILMGLSLAGVSLPSFVVGILLIFVFSVKLGWLPSFGRGEVVQIGWWTTGLLTVTGLTSIVLPSLTLAIGQVALVARLVRSEMLEVLRADYIRFARARGLKPRVIYLSHALRNTMIPVITVSGIQLGFLIAFSVVVEAVFQWPGLGLLFIQALASTDVPVISAFLLLATCAFLFINTVVDLLYLVADPRLRATGGSRDGAI